MVRDDVCRLEGLAVVVTGAPGLGHAVPPLVLVEPRGAEAALQTDLVTLLVRVREGAAGQVAGGSTPQVHLARRAAQGWRTERTAASAATPSDTDMAAAPGVQVPSCICAVTTLLSCYQQVSFQADHKCYRAPEFPKPGR